MIVYLLQSPGGWLCGADGLVIAYTSRALAVQAAELTTYNVLPVKILAHVPGSVHALRAAREAAKQ